MTDSAALLADLKAQLRLLKQDLRAQIDDEISGTGYVDGTGLGPTLRTKYDRAFKNKRTGLTWTAWRDNEIDQIAVAWLVATTFVRFCEDNHLLDGARDANGKLVPTVWLAGPGGRTELAVEYQGEFFRGTTRNRRDWILQAFAILTAQPAGRGLVDPTYVTGSLISAAAADRLVDFWRRSTPDGDPVHDFADDRLDTRFLGDLYQDLSEHARKTYALLQTPVFVEEFILDLTLEPAVKEHGLRDFKVIDPTCGSGHFLLGAFARLERHWADLDPTLDARARMLSAMAAIHGVDLNPFAVAIARFRLAVAGMLSAGIRSLVEAPSMPFNLAVGDSLLAEQGGTNEEQQLFQEDRLFDDGTLDLGLDHTLEDAISATRHDALGAPVKESSSAAEGEGDASDYREVLKPGTYHAVVGNPPYIQVEDSALKEAYRRAWKSAHREYALTIPFAELFFRLAIRGSRNVPAGYVGQITGNSFIKQDFGKKLIEEFFAGYYAKDGRPVELTHVVDTSGAYIPGHGTPTVILVGRTREARGESVRAVLRVKGEPGQPEEPSRANVWSEIVSHIGHPGHSGAYVSVVDLPRSRFDKHPWLLNRGAYETVDTLAEASGRKLSSAVAIFGYTGQTNADGAFLAPGSSLARRGVESDVVRKFVTGDNVRDYSVQTAGSSIFPYSATGLVDIDDYPGMTRWLWPVRAATWARATFSKKTYRQEGRTWWEWHQVNTDRVGGLAITYPSIATVQHVALDRDDRVFNRHASFLRLPQESKLDEYVNLLGVLGSSTATFWLKQFCHDKGNGGIGGGIGDEPWEPRYEFTGSKLQEFPLPPSFPFARARALESLAQQVAATSPSAVIGQWLTHGGTDDLRTVLSNADANWSKLRRQMIFEQEELDWEVYHRYGLLSEDMTWTERDGRFLDLGERAVEIALARQVAAGETSTAWFDRHRSTPITDLPSIWPTAYRVLVQRRLDLIADDPTINLLERPEYKRRWSTPGWNALQRDALTEAIRDRLEDSSLWEDGLGPATRSVAQLADGVRGDAVVRALVDALEGDDADLTAVLVQVVETEAVPYLAALRLKDSGMATFVEWQRVWDLQRREDAGEKVEIPVPPKYVSGDFRKPSYAKARGALDVPKERFVLYPGIVRSGDRTPVLGWAGWDDATQARALAREITEQQAEGAEADVLVPLVAGLLELLPWLHQWHAEPDETFGMSPAEAIDGFISGQLEMLGLSRQEVAAWRPKTTRRGRAGAR